MRRSIVTTYCILSERLGEVTQLSLRKQFCLQYLRWGYTAKEEDRDLFVELAKQWRKQEKRTGIHRTLLERKARKLFKKVKRKKSYQPVKEGARKWGFLSKEKGIGVHSPEYKQQLTEFNRKLRKLQIERGQNPTTKMWIVTSPEGETFKVFGLSQFCREHGLDQANLRKTAIFPNKTHKGWSCQFYSEDWDYL